MAGLAVAAIAILWLLSGRNQESTAPAGLVDITRAENTQGFTRATGPVPFTFPQDHGPHPDYQSEWGFAV